MFKMWLESILALYIMILLNVFKNMKTCLTTLDTLRINGMLEYLIVRIWGEEERNGRFYSGLLIVITTIIITLNKIHQHKMFYRRPLNIHNVQKTTTWHLQRIKDVWKLFYKRFVYYDVWKVNIRLLWDLSFRHS